MSLVQIGVMLIVFVAIVLLFPTVRELPLLGGG